MEDEIKDEKTAEELIVNQWFVDHFSNCGFPTELYNKVYAAKEDLIVRLRKEA
jgi:hypothetical protein